MQTTAPNEVTAAFWAFLGSGIAAIGFGLLLAGYRSSRAAKVTKNLKEAVTTLASMSSNASARTEEERTALTEAHDKYVDVASKILELLPEPDRLPGAAMLIGLVLMFLAAMAAGIVTIAT